MEKYYLLLVLLLTFLLITPIAHSVNIIDIYYNGTVIFYLDNVSKVTLIGTNIENLRVIGSSYIQNHSELILENPNVPTEITYNAKLGNEIIVNESFNALINVTLPSNSNIYYLEPLPINFVVNPMGITVTFNSSSVAVFYGIIQTPYTQNAQNTNFYIILASLIVSTSITIFLIYLLLKERRKELFTKVEPVLENPDSLDERDKEILKSIKEGLNTIAKISQATGIPRATVYRRLKRLEKLGYVKEVRAKGKVIYMINDNKNE